MAVLVSVVIPVFNSAKTIVNALESVCHQSYQDWEVIVVDDGSEDETQAVIHTAFDGPLAPWRDRLTLVEQANQGSAAARNHGIRLAKGEWVAFLDSDDWFLRMDKLEEQVKLTENADCIHTGWQRVDGQGRCIREVYPWEYAPNLDLVDWLRWKPIRLSGLLVSKAWLERMDGFDESLRQSHDVDLLLRLTYAGCRSVWWKAIAVAYRQHEGNTTRHAQVQAKSVQQWLDRFFAQTDLPPDIQDMENRVRHHTYVWVAWALYRGGEYGEMARYLERSFSHGTQMPSTVPGTWIRRFEQCADKNGEPFDADALTEQPEWQEAVRSVFQARSLQTADSEDA